jgi:hypothetical protein
MSKGFIQVRCGISDHLLSSALGAFDIGVYLIILLQVDFESGIWTGSAPRLLASAPRGAGLRDMQRSLQLLEKIGFIRIFHRHGLRGNYRVLINKYEPQFGALRGKRLNAAKSDNWRHPVYESCAVGVAVSDAEVGSVPAAETAPYPYSESEKDSKVAKKQGDSALAAAAEAAQPVAFQSLLFVVNQAQDAKLVDTYPWVDRGQEYKKMALWCEANRPGRRVRNALAFAQNWFNKIPCPTTRRSNGDGRNGAGAVRPEAGRPTKPGAARIENTLPN